MTFQYFKPSGILSHFISYYWTLEAEDYEGTVCERVVPTGNIQLMFHYHNSFLMKRNTDRLTCSQPQAFLSGISSTYVDVSTRGRSGLVAVVFFPLGACNFFEFSLDEIRDQNVNLESICSTEIKDIEDQLSGAEDNLQRINIIERFLLKRLSPVNRYDTALVNEGVNIINQHKGLISADNLSRRLSVTGRSLERKFTMYIGETPKQYAKIVRFQHVLTDMNRISECNFTRLAIDHGYFDQSHFIKDFKSFTGYTPREYHTLCRCIG